MLPIKILLKCAAIIAITLSLLMWGGTAMAVTPGVCAGKLPNPITDICWKCIFPMRIGGASIAGFGQEDYTVGDVSSPVCFCPAPPPVFVRPGVSISFWEPYRLMEVVRQPYCFPSLAGTQLAVGVYAPEGTRGSMLPAAQGKKTSTAFYQAHYFIYPLFSILNMFVNMACSSSGGFDLAYITELDPLWADDELSFILNPEAVIFANPVAQAACAADCVASSAGFPLSALFWCAGCQGNIYPLNGRISGSEVTAGGVDSSVLIVQKMLFKLHRQGLLWGSIGSGALCGEYPMPLMTKGQYKTQLMHPIPQTAGAGPLHPFCCQPLGRTTSLWGMGKSFPVAGEDFVYMIWRRRNCCAF